MKEKKITGQLNAVHKDKIEEKKARTQRKKSDSLSLIPSLTMMMYG